MQGGGGGGGGEGGVQVYMRDWLSKCVCLRERERERENSELRTQNSELYYSRIEILGSSLFLQSVLAMLHRQHI